MQRYDAVKGLCNMTATIAVVWNIMPQIAKNRDGSMEHALLVVPAIIRWPLAPNPIMSNKRRRVAGRNKNSLVSRVGK